MKLLHVFKTYLPDSFTGIERVIWEIAEGTASHGIESQVLTLSANPLPQTLAVGRHLVHRARLDLHVASTGLSLSVFGLFRRLAAVSDIIHYHFPWPLMDVMAVTSGLRKPSVVTYHSDVVRQKALGFAYAPLMHAFLSRANRIVATSPNYAASSPVLRRYEDKVSVIPIGLDANAVHKPTGDELTSWQSRLPPRFLLFLGVLRYYKGLTCLLEAARQTRLPVIIAGDGPLRAEVQRSAPSNVQLVGQVTDRDKAALLQLAAGFVFPSHLRSEAFGIALLEAAMAGKPLISCEIGTGTSYINIDGETGFVVPPADADALAAAMRRLWDNRDQAQEMGRRARARYEAVLTAEQMAKAYAELYRSVLSH